MGQRYATPVGQHKHRMVHGALNYLATQICYFNTPDEIIIT